jgi:peptidyl-prolyl cis-trans isomerase SurA
MFRSARIPLAAAALWLAVLPVVQAQPQAPGKRVPVVALDRIVAVVNDEVITQIELAARVKIAEAQLARQGTPPVPRETLERQLLERLIVDRVQLHVARDTGIRVDDAQLEKVLSRIAADNKMTLSEFRDAIRRDGFSFERFREDLREEIIISRLREREVDARITVTESEIDNFLANEKANLAAADEINLAHILVRVPEGASPEQLAERRARAEQALALLRKGADFAQTAASFSDAPDALKGGVLGPRTADRLPAIFADAAQALKAGETSAVLRSPAGFHIVRVLERRGGGVKPVVIEQARVRHILVRVNELTSEADARNRIRGLRDRIVNGGARFDELARLHSEDGSAARGGDLGWVSPGETVPDFERTFAALKIGELSEPVRTEFGVHLIEVLERRKEDVSAERLRLAARNAIRARKAEEAYQEWVRQQRDRAFVSIRLEER